MSRQNRRNDGFQPLDIRQHRTGWQSWWDSSKPNLLSAKNSYEAVLGRGVQQSPWTEECGRESEKASEARMRETEHWDTGALPRDSCRDMQWVSLQFSAECCQNMCVIWLVKARGKNQPREAEKTMCTKCAVQEWFVFLPARIETLAILIIHQVAASRVRQD